MDKSASEGFDLARGLLLFRGIWRFCKLPKARSPVNYSDLAGTSTAESIIRARTAPRAPEAIAGTLGTP
jgi:hypothetical protein